MPELLVGTTLADFHEAMALKERDDFSRLEDRDGPHV